MVDLVYLNTNDPDITKLIIKLLRRNKKVFTKYLLK